jgi:NRPS condensation-like uncharacterized protein
MHYRAEIFDLMQLLFDETGFNDHQLHGEIHFDSRLDEAALKEALMLSLASIPILATKFSSRPGRAVWESIPRDDLERAFAATEDAATFEAERTFSIREEIGPQVRACVLRAERSALAITMNHMVADGEGFKEYLYFLCDTYSRLRRDPGYVPPTIAGDRGIGEIMRAFGAWEKMGAWLRQRGDTNRSGTLTFPFDTAKGSQPFIATREMSRERISRLKAYCKARGATINDAALAAYYRVLARYIGPPALDGLEVPIMIDMRRYLKDKRFDALRNLASTTVTRLKMEPGETFDQTLKKAKVLMDRLKRSHLGLGGYIKVWLLFGLSGERRAFRLMQHGLRHPLICMTNIGEIDATRLRFEGTAVVSAYVCGSIKHKPHFQIALSGFDGTITLSSNLYGTPQDRKRIDAFLSEVENELDLRAA